LVAGKGLLSGMYSHVRLKFTRHRERLVTQVTTERLLTRVSPNMNIQPTLGGVIPVTENTEVLHGLRLAGYCE
jgi:hypothetical protein